MKPTALETLSALQKRGRSMLLVSLILFLISLFALVSHWQIAYPLIAFSCLFHLISNRLCKRRCAHAYTRALMEHAVGDRFAVTTYASAEPADGLLEQKGLIPCACCVPGARQHHVLRGSTGHGAFSIGEVAFLRKSGPHAVKTLSGTLIVMDGILPEKERWILQYREPLADFCSMEEYIQNGYVQESASPMSPQDEYVVWKHPGSGAEHLAPCMSILQSDRKPYPAALAAHDGSLSLLIAGSYYAPRKVNSAQPLDPDTLQGFQLPGFRMMERMVDSMERL